jgi:hypothetical protein
MRSTHKGAVDGQPPRLYAVFDGRRIAYRGKPGTAQAQTWLSRCRATRSLTRTIPTGVAVYINGKAVQ